MTDQIDNFGELQRPERIQLLFEEIRNLQMSVNELAEKQEMIRKQVERNEKLIKGGNQPSKQLKIEENGGPGCLAVGKVMQKAKKGAVHKGVTSSEAEDILQDQGYDRSRQAVLNMMQKISTKFPGFAYKKRKSEGKENVLFYKPQK